MPEGRVLASASLDYSGLTIGRRAARGLRLEDTYDHYALLLPAYDFRVQRHDCTARRCGRTCMHAKCAYIQYIL
jgi:hypothetical protein